MKKKWLSALLVTAMVTGLAAGCGNNGEEEPSEEYDSPATLYPTLPVEDKIALLSFLCDVSICSKSVHTYMDNCEEQLTQLRKDKIELNRERKRW